MEVGYKVKVEPFKNVFSNKTFTDIVEETQNILQNNTFENLRLTGQNITNSRMESGKTLHIISEKQTKTKKK